MVRSLTRRDSFEFISSEVISEEVVAIDMLPPIIGTTFCDVFTNSTLDLGELNRDELVTVTYLSLNASLSYEVKKDLFYITGGVEFKTPIFSLREREIATFSSEDFQGETQCTWERRQLIDRTGNNFRNSNLALNVGLNYKVAERILIQVGISRDVADMFVFEPNESNFITDRLTAAEAFLKLKYQIPSAQNQKVPAGG